MKVSRSRVGLVSLGLGLLLAAVFLFCLGLGTVDISTAQVWAWLGGRLEEGSAAVILTNFRLPRLLLAALVGISLSLSGTVFQGVLRNPLAEPFILGVSGGAAAGAVLSLVMSLGGTWTTSLLAFAGALTTVFLVLGIARWRGRMETATLVLAGVMVNAFFTAVIMFVISTTTDQKLHAIMFWLYGDLSGARLDQLWLLAVVSLAGGGVLFSYSRQLNLISAGDQTAAALGVNVERTKLVLLTLVSLLCGVTVSLSGLIGFVGLMVPHLVRMVLGADHRLLLPAAGLFGASFMIAADTAARTVISPIQLPVGVVTATLGAPFFLLLLAKRGSRWW
ncbi:MAG: iron ABC transporter permease [Deltaproteobacteria bacterium]|nr:iron ABC transporter permease [Deltaproteobacteria bacterium]